MSEVFAATSSPRALVVEDDADVLVLLGSHLRRLVTMPGLSGIDVCRALGANAATADLAVILLTARAHESDVEAGFDSGADDYVIKPFSPRELLSLVEAVLARVRR